MFNCLFARKRTNEASSKLRRVIDLTTKIRLQEEDRREMTRCPRNLPVLITPWEGKQSPPGDTHGGVLQNISDQGMRLLFLKQPSQAQYIVTINLLQVEPAEIFHFLAEVRNVEHFAPEIFTVGLEVTDILDERTMTAELRSHLRMHLCEQAATI